MDDATRTELEAATFRALRDHLRARTDVQNIDLMNLAGFCRNCLSRWYQEAADARGIALSKDEGREIVYGMPYDEWARPPPDRPEARGEGTDPTVRCPKPFAGFVRDALSAGGDRAAIAEPRRAPRAGPRPETDAALAAGSTPADCRRCRGPTPSCRRATRSGMG